jgi:flagellar biosynthesis/type III secretory pathway M-ring protein FliF/YscJ
MGKQYAINILSAISIILLFLGMSFVFISNISEENEKNLTQKLSMSSAELINENHSEIDSTDDSDEDSILMDELAQEQESKVDELVK